MYCRFDFALSRFIGPNPLVRRRTVQRYGGERLTELDTPTEQHHGYVVWSPDGTFEQLGWAPDPRESLRALAAQGRFPPKISQYRVRVCWIPRRPSHSVPESAVLRYAL